MSAVANVWRNLPLKAKIGVWLFGFFVLAAIIGPEVAPYDPSYANPDPALLQAHPSAQHLLGTTQTGQDVLSQLLVGIRLTIELALLVGVIATALSVIVGVTSAFLGGVWDEVLSLLTNVFLVIPALPLLILLLGYLPGKGQLPTIIVLSGLGWPWGARVIRAQTLMIRNRDFIAAARESGEKSWRIIVLRHHPERDQPDRGQLRQHRALRDRRLGGAGLRRPHRPQQLVARHHLVLGAEPAGAATRRVVVVRAAWPRGRAHRHLPGAAQHRDRRARQPAAACLARRGEDRRPAHLAHRPDPGATRSSPRAAAGSVPSCTPSRAGHCSTRPLPEVSSDEPDP